MKNYSNMNKKYLLFLIFVLLLSLFSCKTRSENKGALSFKNGKCLAFYPSDSENMAEYVKKLCEKGDKKVYDYHLEKAGDFYVAYYSDGKKFYLDEEYHDLKPVINKGEEILSDLLRYRMKKDGYDLAYSSVFWPSTKPEVLDLSHIDLEIENDELKLYFDDFDYLMKLPINFIHALTDLDLGFEESLEYEAGRYVDPNRPMVALTYDDGPYDPVDRVLYETLVEYGGVATFYLVGSRMNQKELENIAQGISLGMEFGSHTEYHANLSKQSLEKAKQAVLQPVEYVRDKLGYEMKTYRPPYGARNYKMEEVIGMIAVLWTLDTRDWSNRDEKITYNKAMDNVEDGDIILMHSLYPSTAKASERLIPDLMDRGFQLVSVSELLYYKGIDVDGLKAYGSN